jgi:hypothetical protein
MVCETCAREIDSVTCKGCGKPIAKLGPFCYYCGCKIEEEAGQAGAPAMDENCEGPDFASRVLCSDGTCIGVINEQGVCKVCGKPYAPES